MYQFSVVMQLSLQYGRWDPCILNYNLQLVDFDVISLHVCPKYSPSPIRYKLLFRHIGLEFYHNFFLKVSILIIWTKAFFTTCPKLLDCYTAPMVYSQRGCISVCLSVQVFIQHSSPSQCETNKITAREESVNVQFSPDFTHAYQVFFLQSSFSQHHLLIQSLCQEVAVAEGSSYEISITSDQDNTLYWTGS